MAVKRFSLITSENSVSSAKAAKESVIESGMLRRLLPETLESPSVSRQNIIQMSNNDERIAELM